MPTNFTSKTTGDLINASDVDQFIAPINNLENSLPHYLPLAGGTMTGFIGGPNLGFRDAGSPQNLPSGGAVSAIPGGATLGANGIYIINLAMDSIGSFGILMQVYKYSPTYVGRFVLVSAADILSSPGGSFSDYVVFSNPVANKLSIQVDTSDYGIHFKNDSSHLVTYTIKQLCGW